MTNEERLPVLAPLAGTIVSFAAIDGAAVRAGQELVVLESMKMHHGVESPVDGLLWTAGLAVGDVVAEGDPLVYVDPAPPGTSQPLTGQQLAVESGERAD